VRTGAQGEDEERLVSSGSSRMSRRRRRDRSAGMLEA
jgi:hypothetical protein